MPPDQPLELDFSLLSDSWRDVRLTAEATELEKELNRELSHSHLLSGVECRAVAVRRFNKETIWWLPLAGQWAVVHLTWNAEASPQWPSTTIHQTWLDVVAELADRGRP